MPLLQVRDMPQDLYEKLGRVAAEDNRSIAQETIFLLKRTLDYGEERQARRKRVLAEIKANRIEDARGFPDPADLVREDRER